MEEDQRPDGAEPIAERLEAWKEIASYLKRGVTTVQRWERTEGLPVRRLPHTKSGSVFAYRSEIDVWWRQRTALLEQKGGARTAHREAGLVCRLIWWDRELALGEGENILGRGSESAVFLDEAKVSRRHARITVSGGEATLEDLGSRNGTYVGGRRLESPQRLRDRDEIRIGSVRMIFRSTPRPGSTESASGA